MKKDLLKAVEKFQSALKSNPIHLLRTSRLQTFNLQFLPSPCEAVMYHLRPRIIGISRELIKSALIERQQSRTIQLTQHRVDILIHQRNDR